MLSSTVIAVDATKSPSKMSVRQSVLKNGCLVSLYLQAK